MRVAINSRILSTKNLRGWGRYTANLIRELSQLEVELFLVSDRDINVDHLKGSNLKNMEVVVKNKSPYILWEQQCLPTLCEKLDVDILHCPHHFGLPVLGRFKKILTIHDTIEDTFSKKQRGFSERFKRSSWQNDSLRWMTRHQADGVLTVSEYSKKEIQKVYGIDAEKIQVTYGAADPSLLTSQVESFEFIKQNYGIKDPYFLYVGGFDPRKNIPFLINVFNHQENNVQAQLVVAGAGAKDLYASSQGQNAICIDYIPENHLASFYSHAKALVYPSLHEGFGLQAVEAMALGTPALVSDRTSLPEVVNNPDVLFDPENSKSLVELLQKVLKDEAFFNKSRQEASVRAKDFSWTNTAIKTFEFYAQVLGEAK